jgi:hypothetical protein
VCGTLVVGQIISPADLTRVIWLNAALLVVAAEATALVPEVAAQSAPHSGASKVASEVRRLLGIARFRILIVVSALIYGSHAMHDAFAVIRWSNAGIDTFVISLLWSEAVAAEVMVFFLIGPAVLNRFGARGAAALAAAAGIMRWSIAAMTNSVMVLAILQPLHGLTFALLHLACMRMMGPFHPRPFGRNRPNSLRVWFRRCDGGIDAVFRIFLCELWGSGISCDGASLRPRITACLVRLFRAAGFAASHRMSNAVLPAVLQRQDA